MADIAIIGLGLVGSALVQRFRLAGMSIVGFDPLVAKLDGVSLAGMAIAAARQSDWIVLSLPNSDVVQSVVREVESACAGKTIIDTTTGDPERTAALGERLNGIGVRYVDATVTGSSQQVREGTVIVTAGGPPDVVRKCSRFFDAFARDWFHVGPWGSGSLMKLALNLVLGLNRAVLAEGLSFAKSCGLDPAAALEVFKASPAFSRVMETKGSRMIDGNFEPVARLRQHWKDVRLIQEQAKRNGQCVPLSDLHERLLADLDSQGFGELDNCAIIKAFGGD